PPLAARRPRRGGIGAARGARSQPSLPGGATESWAGSLSPRPDRPGRWRVGAVQGAGPEPSAGSRVSIHGGRERGAVRRVRGYRERAVGLVGDTRKPGRVTTQAGRRMRFESAGEGDRKS